MNSLTSDNVSKATTGSVGPQETRPRASSVIAPPPPAALRKELERAQEALHLSTVDREIAQASLMQKQSPETVKQAGIMARQFEACEQGIEKVKRQITFDGAYRPGVEKAVNKYEETFPAIQTTMRKFMMPGIGQSVYQGLVELGVLHNVTVEGDIDRKTLIDILCKYISFAPDEASAAKIAGECILKLVKEKNLDDKTLAVVLVKLADHLFEAKLEHYERVVGTNTDLTEKIQVLQGRLGEIDREIDAINELQQANSVTIGEHKKLLDDEKGLILQILNAPLEKHTLALLDQAPRMQFFQEAIDAIVAKASGGEIKDFVGLLQKQRGLIAQYTRYEEDRQSQVDRQTSGIVREQTNLRKQCDDLVAKRERASETEVRGIQEDLAKLRGAIRELDTQRMKIISGIEKDLQRKYSAELQDLVPKMGAFVKLCTDINRQFLAVMDDVKDPKTQSVLQQGLVGQKMDQFAAANKLIESGAELKKASEHVAEEKGKVTSDLIILKGAQSSLKAIRGHKLEESRPLGQILAKTWREEFAHTSPKEHGIDTRGEQKALGRHVNDAVCQVVDRFSLVQRFYEEKSASK